MKRLLLSLAVLLPLAATAQYEPTYGESPAYGSRRSPFYFGVGLGTGNGNLSGQGTTLSFDEWHGGANAPTNGFLNVKAGVTLAPGLLVGGDLSGMFSQLDEAGFVSTISIVNLDGVVTWFPAAEGFFVRGGAGVSTLKLDWGSTTDSWSGVNVIGGVGYAFWLGERFNLTVNADYSVQSYGSSSTSPESSSFFAVWAGFDWY